MSNSPRKVGKLSPAYLPKLADDSGNLVNLGGVSASAFSMTMLNISTGQIKVCTGTWSLVVDPLDNITKPSYAFQAADLDTPGPWLITVYMQRPEGQLPFDPDFMIVEP